MNHRVVVGELELNVETDHRMIGAKCAYAASKRTATRDHVHHGPGTSVRPFRDERRKADRWVRAVGQRNAAQRAACLVCRDLTQAIGQARGGEVTLIKSHGDRVRRARVAQGDRSVREVGNERTGSGHD